MTMADSDSVTKHHEMSLGNSTEASPLYGMALPEAMRNSILEAVVRQKHPGWASFASVCKEWQLFIEKRNFRQLRLKVRCLDEFQRMVSRRRELIRHIWLDIELPTYTCQCCSWDESDSLTARNDSIISGAVWRLLSILSDWTPGKNSLALELNA